MKTTLASLAYAALLAPTACLSHHVETEPVEIKPIHVVVDVNVRVQRELQEFFDFEGQVDPTTERLPQRKE